MLIPSSIIAIAYFLAAYLKLRSKQYEHALARFILGAVYVVIGAGMPIEDARALSRWFVFMLPTIEIISWVVRKHANRD